uniref:Phospholipid/glycerol acyltransferase domain-containing protein n=1 Tax=Oreochromis aureus TaxID=47969 RepID=A0A668TGW7_OREAU
MFPSSTSQLSHLLDTGLHSYRIFSTPQDKNAYHTYWSALLSPVLWWILENTGQPISLIPSQLPGTLSPSPSLAFICQSIIAKESPASLRQEIRGSASCLCSDHEFDMADIFYFCRSGVESIVDDEVTKRFSAQELESWNLLTRSNYNFHHINMRLTLLWGLGLLTRYGILLPLRVILAVTGISLFLFFTTLVGFLPNAALRSYLSKKVHMMGYRMCVSSLMAIITYHNRENKPKNGAICVANHTTPIDVIILASDRCYSLVQHFVSLSLCWTDASWVAGDDPKRNGQILPAHLV